MVRMPAASRPAREGETPSQIPELRPKAPARRPHSHCGRGAHRRAYRVGDLTDLVDGSVLWPGDYFANGKDLQKFLRNDSNLIFQNLPNVTKSSDTLTVGGISQKCTLLEVQISGQDFVHILLALKDELGSDQEVRSLMQAFAEDCAAVFPYDAPSLSDLSRIFQTFLAALEDEAREISSSADARTAC